MVVEAVERLTDTTGQKLLIPEVEVAAWWTNLPESEAVCIELYRDHATSEQFHSEFKAALSYNCLRRIGQEALTCQDILPVKVEVARRRLRSVLQDLIYIGCKFTRHANTVIVKFGRTCPWFDCFREIYARC